MRKLLDLLIKATCCFILTVILFVCIVFIIFYYKKRIIVASKVHPVREYACFCKQPKHPCAVQDCSCDPNNFKQFYSRLFGCSLFASSGDGIATRFHYKGYWEHSREILNLLQGIKNETGEEDIVFMDVGANIGAFSIPIAHHGFRTIAIEAHPENVLSLKRGIINNNLQGDVLLLAKAVGDKRQTCLVDRDDKERSTSNARVTCVDVSPNTNLPHSEDDHADDDDEEEEEEGPVGVRIDMVPFSDLVEEITQCNFVSDFNHLKVVKLDIEGFEPHFLRGGLKFFQQFKPIIITEVNRRELERVGGSKCEVTQIMESLGYEVALGDVYEFKDYNAVFTHTESQKELVLKYFNSSSLIDL